MAIIEVRKLAKTYGKVQAVQGIDLDIEKGEIFGLLGPNGAGKTTTIGMLCTIIRPTSGRASIAGHDIVSAPAEVRRKVGIVFQDPTLDTVLTGRENLILHAMLYGVPAELRQKHSVSREFVEAVRGLCRFPRRRLAAPSQLRGGGSVTPLYFFWETQRRILRVRGG